MSYVCTISSSMLLIGTIFFANPSECRYYDPQTGRFLQEDPIRVLAGPNLYTFVRNNPVNFTDPLGFIDKFGINGIVENSIVKELKNLPRCSLTGEEQKKVAREARIEMTNEEFQKLKNKNTTDDEKFQILMDVADRLKEGQKLPSEIQEQIDDLIEQGKSGGTQ